jgi:hypothetical protein
MSELSESVINLLVSDHDFLIEEAEAAVDKSTDSNPEMWNENSDANDLASYLADEAEDE